MKFVRVLKASIELNSVKEEGIYKDSNSPDVLYEVLKIGPDSFDVDVWTFDDEINMYRTDGSLYTLGDEDLKNIYVTKSNKKYRHFGDLREFLKEY